MKQIPFERPSEHYDERLYPIDEQICSLLKQRKDISNDNVKGQLQHLVKEMEND
ncbi:hypothetical protein [Lederbergia citri]|uniref:Uncharacterized protein n=1 Tax=Lederbergia citri TaxID=2833580 RepID=A0A942YH81_9BACI|nr:hypothetical protein [Lederbergia citri]MBS4194166.1 hypothetical protein [Lederbergia citri]